MTYPDFRHGERLTPEALNQRAVKPARRAQPQSPAMVVVSSAQATNLYPVATQPRPLWAVIIGKREFPESEAEEKPVRIEYEWAEVIAGERRERDENVDSDFWQEPVNGHRSSFNEEHNFINEPAIEANAHAGVPVGTIVYLKPRNPYLELTRTGDPHTVFSWAFTFNPTGQAFTVAEDLIPGQIEGGGGTQSPPDAEITSDLFVRGYLLADPDREELEFYPPDRQDRFEDTDDLFDGVYRPESQYYKGTRGWAQWIARAHRDDESEQIKWVGHWQIVSTNASTIFDAETCGPFQISDSDAAGRTFSVALNLVGLIETGDTIRVKENTRANDGKFSVTDVSWNSGTDETDITVSEAVGLDGEGVGNLGKIIIDGGTGCVDLWWTDEDETHDSPTLIDSQYDVEIVNYIERDLEPGERIQIYWDRQEYRWHVFHRPNPTSERLHGVVQTGFVNASGSAIRTVSIKSSDWKGDDVTGDAFDVSTRIRPNKDTALFTGYLVSYHEEPDGALVVDNDIWDEPIGTVVWEGLDLANIRDGWALCDGVATIPSKGGINVPDLRRDFIMSIDPADGAGDGSENTLGDTGGFSKHGPTENNHPDHANLDDHEHSGSSGTFHTVDNLLQFIDDHVHEQSSVAQSWEHEDTDNRSRFAVMAARIRND